ncbi:MAG: phosphoenolpyruvate carboxykinase-domain-containing protein [Monoraphidium minutum]|nr:MAG: phosphoenolpyruvate carboxykinase-domain-containing protein [Monoraphidium minutum]
MQRKSLEDAASGFVLPYSGLHPKKVYRNLPVAALYELALQHEPGTIITSTGALATLSGAKTGRSPKDKRVVKEPSTEKDVWWRDAHNSSPNYEIDERSFLVNRETAMCHLNSRPHIFVFDGFANWSPESRIKVRVITERAYHALFMSNMLIRPTPAELDDFGDPEFVIFNGGAFPANRYCPFMTSPTSVAISLKHREMVILGTEYAGEMKKGVFSYMHYLMPKRGILSLHSGCNVGAHGDVTLFFGLSAVRALWRTCAVVHHGAARLAPVPVGGAEGGTGKTTLSTEPHRPLIGDDEHCWGDNGVWNIEGGCYAKCIGLQANSEPEIFKAIRCAGGGFGTVLENVVVKPETRQVHYASSALTENTRAKLTLEQAMYHFISGYTSKVAGTEMGVTEPEATFSACYGGAFW